MSVLLDLLCSRGRAIPYLMSAINGSIPNGMGTFDYAILNLARAFFDPIARARFLIPGCCPLNWLRLFIGKDLPYRQSGCQNQREQGNCQCGVKLHGAKD